MAHAADERRGRIDRIRERHLLTSRVVHEATATISNQLTDREGHLQRVSAQPRLISTENDVARLDVIPESSQLGPSQKVIASTIVVDVLDALFPRNHEVTTSEILDGEAAAPFALNIERELLVTFVGLRSSKLHAQCRSTSADHSQIRHQLILLHR